MTYEISRPREHLHCQEFVPLNCSREMVLKKLAGSVAWSDPNNTAKMTPRAIYEGNMGRNSHKLPVMPYVTTVFSLVVKPPWSLEGRVRLNSYYTWLLQSLIFSINLFDLGTLRKSNGKFLFIHTQKEGKDPIKFLFHKSSLNSYIFSGCSMNYYI